LLIPQKRTTTTTKERKKKKIKIKIEKKKSIPKTHSPLPSRDEIKETPLK